MRNGFVSISVYFISLCWCAAAVSDQDRLNVVLIVIDDLGWSDLGCYGSDFYDTPQLDRFANDSLQFTSAYAAAPVCSPTRAAIMTGKVPARLDMTIWHEGAVAGGPNHRKLRPAVAQPNLPRDETTLAEMFRAAGYFTAHVGKWHLGTAPYYPETQGFNFHVGGTFWGAPATFFHPFSGRWNQRDPEIRYVPGLPPGKAGDYLPDALTDVALDVMNRVKQGPFFLNLWYYTVHSPIEAPEDLVAKYRDKQPGQRHREPTYAAMVERMDFNVGRVLKWLDDADLLEQTIVIVTSDNGGVDFNQRGIVPTSNAPLRSGKGTLYEGGIRVPLMVRWPGVTSAGQCDAMVSSQDLFPTFADELRRFDIPAARGEVDGVNLKPLLRNTSHKLSRDTLYWHFPHYYARMTPASALRQGDWKLLHYYEDDRLELYDLAADPGEQTDLADTRSEVATKLRQSLDQWREEVGANPPTR